MSRFLWLCPLFILFLGKLSAQGVAIGSSNPPDSSAVLHLQSNSKGFLLPRLTTQERNSIQNPAEGLQIYNTTTKCIEAHFPVGWKSVACDCTNPPPPPNMVFGPSLVCPADTGLGFWITPVPSATSYTWFIDPQDTLSFGSGTDSIAVRVSNQQGLRNIQVQAVNACGASAPVSLALNVQNPVAAFSLSPSSPIVNNAAQFNASTSNASFQWSFQNGNPGNSSSQNPQVTWTQTGQMQVQLIATSSAGCIDTLDSLITVTNCQANTWQFTNCGATGRSGPSQSQCNSTYGMGVVVVSGGIQQWQVPASGIYRITAAGASGGNGTDGNTTPGLGAQMQGEFNLNAGTFLQILVGQQGLADGGGGGGGGSFVWVSGANQLLVAAGGGGGTGDQGQSSTPGAENGRNGTSALNGTASGANVGSGGNNGNGGQSGGGGAGAGWLSNGGGSSLGGQSPLNGGLGGNNGNVSGGFGGGGANESNSSDSEAAGGGGGYSGGGSGNGSEDDGGGGGGSFNGGANQSNASGVRSGHGFVTIARICP